MGAYFSRNSDLEIICNLRDNFVNFPNEQYIAQNRQKFTKKDLSFSSTPTWNNLNHIFAQYCNSGNIKATQWFFAEFKLTKEDIDESYYVILCACLSKNLDLVFWLNNISVFSKEVLMENDNKLFSLVCSNNDLDMAIWLDKQCVFLKNRVSIDELILMISFIISESCLLSLIILKININKI